MPPARLILHVGLPKTGTTALQRWCDSNRAELRRRGVDYPEVEKHLVAPKHQFLVGCFHSNNFEKLEAVLSGSSEKEIVLSTEGITNHFYDFPSESFESFKNISKEYCVDIFLVERDVERWARSYYKQAVINPPILKYNYATPLPYEQFVQLPRVQRLVSNLQLREDLRRGLGASSLKVTAYEDDWLSSFMAMLNISPSDEFKPLTQENNSVSDDLVELIRQVNGMGLSANERAGFIEAIRHCFQTNHQVLNFFHFAKEDEIPKQVDHVMTRLVARTPKQAEMIEKLSASIHRAAKTSSSS